MDPEKLKDTARCVFDALGGAMTATMIHLGDRLGLYRALFELGDASSEELARHAALSERWVREWLYQQGAAGLLEHRGNLRFALSEEAAALLADEGHPAFGAGFFAHLPQQLRVVEQLPSAFRSGIGLPYDAMGPEGAAGTERGLAPWFRSLLVPTVLPRIEGLVSALERGIAVADVGCGGGAALLAMAAAFPSSEFHGYDISRHALALAESNRQSAGISNASFRDPTRDRLPADPTYGFVTTFDCLHDMAHPERVMRAIRSSILPKGIWLIADIKAHPSWEENVEHNPMSAMMYGSSVLTCMSSALSEPDGLGLGTLGFHRELAEQMVRDAGFSSFESIDVDHPVNAFYLVRP
ncbi:MAG: methyltransferase domain-containing protein [Myxococcota bacterium]|jgi:2-polyprenyl-3-methyl-5-hydroxy-6-metoxy-1,4-benzoquinol methylase|nr:methyltransferase domain-containing protein [Myxococcota bacterium]